MLQDEAYNFIQQDTLAQVFSREFYKIFKNTFFVEHLRWLLLFFTDPKVITYLKICFRITQITKEWGELKTLY